MQAIWYENFIFRPQKTQRTFLHSIFPPLAAESAPCHRRRETVFKILWPDFELTKNHGLAAVCGGAGTLPQAVIIRGTHLYFPLFYAFFNASRQSPHPATNGGKPCSKFCGQTLNCRKPLLGGCLWRHERPAASCDNSGGILIFFLFYTSFNALRQSPLSCHKRPKTVSKMLWTDFELPKKRGLAAVCGGVGTLSRIFWVVVFFAVIDSDLCYNRVRDGKFKNTYVRAKSMAAQFVAPGAAFPAADRRVRGWMRDVAAAACHHAGPARGGSGIRKAARYSAIFGRTSVLLPHHRQAARKTTRLASAGIGG
jgi:hypothetical protein